MMSININPEIEKTIRHIVVDITPRHGAISRIVDEALLLWLERRNQEMVLEIEKVKQDEINNPTLA